MMMSGSHWPVLLFQVIEDPLQLALLLRLHGDEDLGGASGLAEGRALVQRLAVVLDQHVLVIAAHAQEIKEKGNQQVTEQLSRRHHRRKTKWHLMFLEQFDWALPTIFPMRPGLQMLLSAQPVYLNNISDMCSSRRGGGVALRSRSKYPAGLFAFIKRSAFEDKVDVLRRSHFFMYFSNCKSKYRLDSAWS